MTGATHSSFLRPSIDSTCGFATMFNLPEEAEGFTTIEIKTNFIGTARDGAIRCEGTPAHIGRRTQVWDARVWDETSTRDIALFRCNQMILPEQQ